MSQATGTENMDRLRRLHDAVRYHPKWTPHQIARYAKCGVTYAVKARRVLRDGSQDMKDALMAGTLSVDRGYQTLKPIRIRTAGQLGLTKSGVLLRGASAHTPKKVGRLEQLYNALLPCYPQPFAYIETNAGPGIYHAHETGGTDGVYGSPLQFLRAVAKHEVAASVVLIDKNPEVLGRLLKSVAEQVDVLKCNLSFLCTNNRNVISAIRHSRLDRLPGLVFFDPMGVGRDEWVLAGDVACVTGHDLLMHFPWNATERVAATPRRNEHGFRSVLEYVRPIRRKHGLLVKDGRFGWYFGTDSDIRIGVVQRVMGGVRMAEDGAWPVMD